MTAQPIIAFRQPDTFYCLHGNKIIVTTLNGSEKSFTLGDRILPDNMAELNGRIYLAASGYIISVNPNSAPDGTLTYNFAQLDAKVISICSLPKEDILAIALSIQQIVILTSQFKQVGVFSTKNATNVAFKDKNTLTYISEEVLYELDIWTETTKELEHNCVSYSWGPNSALAFSNGIQLTVKNSEEKITLSLSEAIIQLQWTIDGHLVIITLDTVKVWHLKPEDAPKEIFKAPGKICSTAIAPNKKLIGICIDIPERDRHIEILSLETFPSKPN